MAGSAHLLPTSKITNSSVASERTVSSISFTVTDFDAFVETGAGLCGYIQLKSLGFSRKLESRNEQPHICRVFEIWRRRRDCSPHWYMGGEGEVSVGMSLVINTLFQFVRIP